jgi:cbb3-type cytochrome oxidase subunit 3
VALVAAASFVAIIVLVLVCYFFYTYRAAPKAKKK